MMIKGCWKRRNGILSHCSQRKILIIIHLHYMFPLTFLWQNNSMLVSRGSNSCSILCTPLTNIVLTNPKRNKRKFQWSDIHTLISTIFFSSPKWKESVRMLPFRLLTIGVKPSLLNYSDSIFGNIGPFQKQRSSRIWKTLNLTLVLLGVFSIYYLIKRRNLW